MSTRTHQPRARSRLRPPDATRSHEDCLLAYNADLEGLTASELEVEKFRTARLAELYPHCFVWRGMHHISLGQWADERIQLCQELLGTVRPPRKPKSKAWSR